MKNIRKLIIFPEDSWSWKYSWEFIQTVSERLLMKLYGDKEREKTKNY